MASCSTRTIQAPIGDHSNRLVANPAQHIVRQGDSLYSVGFLYGYPIDDIARWNGLKAPYTIYKGQRLRLRPSTVRRAVRASSESQPIAASQPKPRPARRSQPKTATFPVVSSKPKTALASASRPKTSAIKIAPIKSQTTKRLAWIWPVKGPLLQRYRATGNAKKGIDIGGQDGAAIKAAADGKIVYSGSGLGGYGRLIIIKHNKDFLSAYAHNRKLIAKEGQWVKQGEVIALMGSSGTDRTRLHFEIRKRGQPVDPLRYLP